VNGGVGDFLTGLMSKLSTVKVDPIHSFKKCLASSSELSLLCPQVECSQLP